MSICAPRRNGLRPISERKARREAALRDTKSRLLSERNGVCEGAARYIEALNRWHLSDRDAAVLSDAIRHCYGRASDLHHRLQRSLGGDDSDANLNLACRACHSLWHDEIDLAHRLGFLVRSWDHA